MKYYDFYEVYSDIEINESNEDAICEVVEELLDKIAEKYGIERYELNEGLFELHIMELTDCIYGVRLKHIFNVRDVVERTLIIEEEQEEDSENEAVEMIRLIYSITEQTENIDFSMFLNVICMLLEERCKQEERDIVEVAAGMLGTIISVNAEHGRY